MAVAEAIGAAKAIGTTLLNNYMASDRESRARRENYMYNEMSAEAADQRTRNLYFDLYSPKAQMQQIEEAGLSPSVFAGDLAGMSGQAGAQGGGPSGISPNVFGFDPLMAAEIALKHAQTEQIKEETKTEAGENKRGLADIAKIFAERDNYKAAASAQEAQANYTNLATTLKELTFNDDLAKVKADAEQAAASARQTIAEANKAEIDFDIAKETKAERVKQIKETTLNIMADTAKKKSEKALNEEESKAVREKLDQAWEKLNIDFLMAEAQQAAAEAKFAEVDAIIENAANKIANDKEIAELNNDTARGNALLGFAKGILSAVIYGSVLYLVKNPTAAGAAATVGPQVIDGLGGLFGY